MTVAPGSAVPNTGTVVLRCRTMFELNIGATDKAANAEVNGRTSSEQAMPTALVVHFNVVVFIIVDLVVWLFLLLVTGM
jgi:hypothetical protein